MTHGGAGRGQGRKPLARRVEGMRVWVPVRSEREREQINSLSASERRARLLGEETHPMRTYRYEDLPAEKLSAMDLRLEHENDPTGELYRIYIFGADGRAEAETAEVLYCPQSGRVGIAWGADADWMDSTGDIERDIDIWLNDPDEFEARN